eukprot:TRINITY_DN5642_c0_g1_i2.p2 TRINITY_DN5642_c0_g1~~TRINITY_DN5642_c0_g1_i2.p2  ORF type:complete len:115 (-),score=28.22 TRINITY_DN5642_c0_g1_i2:10-354(-)
MMKAYMSIAFSHSLSTIRNLKGKINTLQSQVDLLRERKKPVCSHRPIMEHVKKSPVSETPEDSDNESVVSAGDEYCLKGDRAFNGHGEVQDLSLIHICRCRRYAVCRSRWSPYH